MGCFSYSHATLAFFEAYFSNFIEGTEFAVDEAAWVEVEQAQLETMLRATPAQRLAWLEEAMRLAHASGALGAERGAPLGSSLRKRSR